MYIQDLIEDLIKSKLRIGGKDYYPADTVVNRLENLAQKCIRWDEEDFEMRAKDRIDDGEEQGVWDQYYNKDMFSIALEKMISSHNANYGITWDTIDCYMDDYCKIKEFHYGENKV